MVILNGVGMGFFFIIKVKVLRNEKNEIFLKIQGGLARIAMEGFGFDKISSDNVSQCKIRKFVRNII